MILKICPAEAGKKELKFKLKIVDDAIVLLPLLKCTLSVSQEGSNYDKFNEASMSPIIEKTERQEREEFEKTLKEIFRISKVLYRKRTYILLWNLKD